MTEEYNRLYKELLLANGWLTCMNDDNWVKEREEVINYHGIPTQHALRILMIDKGWSKDDLIREIQKL